jgi:hypothetical protein
MKTHALLLSSFVSLFVVACDAPGPDDRFAADDEARTPLGKADHVEGSCAAIDADGPACGGPAPVGNCWCDDACAQYGDCCSDAFEVCGEGEPPPEPAVSQCLSDAQCDDGLTCAGGVCVAIPAEPDCADGTSLSPFCDIAPVCPEGTEKFIVGACFSCLDPATCEPAA